MNRKYRKVIIAGNWKMNKLASDVRPFLQELRGAMPKAKTCDTVICAPAVLATSITRTMRDTRIVCGAQDVSEHDFGAYTGEISASMLADIEVRYCIVGHSERRQYHNETDFQVSAKVKKLLSAGVTPIICVGESLLQREYGLTFDYVTYQTKAALSGLEAKDVRKCVIAYEPIWAIGTGKTATAIQAQEVCAKIRTVIRDNFDARTARSVSILYGGSMNSKNCAELLAQPDIDGGLIGGSSLDPAELAKIIESTVDFE
ncbi:MAG: triose-phosphate isomerase [Ruminococcaceae bacterium]|nr:triose-phosphate isomerase [Oscillospiraceae bacterium]